MPDKKQFITACEHKIKLDVFIIFNIQQSEVAWFYCETLLIITVTVTKFPLHFEKSQKTVFMETVKKKSLKSCKQKKDKW